MKTTIVVGLAVGATLLGATAAPAHAFSGYHKVDSIVTWNGVNCIQIEGPYIGDPWHTGIQSFCGGLSEAVYTVPSGALAGANPIMGNASWISCQVYLDGVLEYSDHAAAGDGHDANCLRRVL